MLGIFGAGGAIGSTVGVESKRRQIPLRVVGRHEAALHSAFGSVVDVVAADLEKPEDAARAAGGLDAIIYAVGVPYDKFELHPLLMRNAVDAARKQNVKKLVVISNVYSYGLPTTSPVDEMHPRKPHTYKGRMRKQQEDIALDAHSDGLRTLVLRLPDFYSADAEKSLAAEIFKAASAGKAAPVFAPIEKPHEWIYTPDIGPVVLDLVSRDEVFGTAYNLAGPRTMSTREFATRIYEQFGQKPKLRVVTTPVLRVLGLFNPLLRELVEMQYLQSNPVILDDTKLRTALGSLKKTSYAEGIARTAAAFRNVAVDFSRPM